jgi:hypothetical protein
MAMLNQGRGRPERDPAARIAALTSVVLATERLSKHLVGPLQAWDGPVHSPTSTVGGPSC